MILKNKKAQVNDSVILLILASVFVALGILVPFVQEGFGSGTIDRNNVNSLLVNENANVSPNASIQAGLVEGVAIGLGPSFAPSVHSVTQQASNPLSAFSVLASIMKMFFWSFTLPIWVDSILLVFRIIFWYLVYKGIRGIGG